jgi:hypothetical protein
VRAHPDGTAVVLYNVGESPVLAGLPDLGGGERWTTLLGPAPATYASADPVGTIDLAPWAFGVYRSVAGTT